MNQILILTANPSFAILSTNEHFVHIECRIGQVNKFIEESVLNHIEYFNKIKESKNLKGYLQLRRVFFNDKGAEFTCVVDYLKDDSDGFEEELKIEKEVSIVDGIYTYIDFKLIDSSFISSHFDKNHRDYYMNERVYPYISDFEEYIVKRASI